MSHAGTRSGSGGSGGGGGGATAGVKRARTSSQSPGSAYASPRLRRRSNSQLPEELLEGATSTGPTSGGSAQSVFTGGPSSTQFANLPPPPSLHAQMQASGGPMSTVSSHRPTSAQTLPSLQSATGWTSTFGPGPSSGGPPDQPMSVRIRQDERESSEGSTIAARDSRERQPRSMMACIRCRKQKMKCDGPSAAPCRGCRSANVTCVFETRSRQRPKSISSMSSLQPLPAIMTTTGGMQTPHFATNPRGGLDTYHLSGMSGSVGSPLARRRDSIISQSSLPPPPPPLSISQQAPPPPSVFISSATVHGSPPLQSAISGYPGPSPSHSGLTPRSSHAALQGRPGPSSVPTFSASHATSHGVRPMSPMGAPTAIPLSTDQRLRLLESSVRTLEPLTTRFNTLQDAVTRLESQQDNIIASVNSLVGSPSQISTSRARTIISAPLPAARPTVNLSDQAWDVYRSYICPLAPWLAMLSSPLGLSGEVVACLTARVDPAVKDVESASGRRVRAEIGRLFAQGTRFTDSDLSALGVFATWEGDDALICAAVGQARMAGKHRALDKGAMRDARAWSELLVLEHLSHAPDFLPCLTNAPVSISWRNRISNREPTSPASRDRDIKLLAWLEYAELLADSQRIVMEDYKSVAVLDPTFDRQSTSSGGPRPEASPGIDTPQRDRMALQRADLLIRWNGWNAQWGGSGDPILSVHFHYAILFITTPMTYTDNVNTWQALAQESAGYEQLERARDAAIDLIRGICSPEIARTLSYSFPIFRSRLALALAHLITHMTFIPHSPITPIPHIQSMLRLAYERLGGGQPSQWPSSTNPPVLGSLLVEVVESGSVAGVGKRDVVGKELGQELWSRLIGGGS